MSAGWEPSPFDRFVEQLEFSPASPDWRRMAPWQRTLAAFSDFMRDQVGDGLVNAPWSDDVREYVAAFRTLGAEQISDAVLELSTLSPGSAQADARLVTLNERVEVDWQMLWVAAQAYADANGWRSD